MAFCVNASICNAVFSGAYITHLVRMCITHATALTFPIPSSVSFGLYREYPWHLSALSVKQGYKPVLKSGLAHVHYLFIYLFSPEVLLRHRLLLRAHLDIFRAVLQSVFIVSELDMDRTQECAVILSTSSTCKLLSLPTNLTLTGAQKCGTINAQPGFQFCLSSLFFNLTF